MQTGGLVLSRLVDFKRIAEPFVGAPGIDEFQGAKGVSEADIQYTSRKDEGAHSRNVFERVAKRMSKVVGGINFCNNSSVTTSDPVSTNLLHVVPVR